MIDNGEEQAGKNGPVSEFILVLVLSIGVHDRQTHESGTVDHQSTAEAGQDQHDEIVIGDQAEQVAEEQAYIYEDGKLVVQLFRYCGPTVNVTYIDEDVP